MQKHVHPAANGPSVQEQSKLGFDFLKRWYQLAKPFYVSKESRVTAWAYTALILGFLIGLTFLNVKLNGAVKGMYNGLASRNETLMMGFFWYAVGLFVFALPVRIIQDFANETFALKWRIFTTMSFIRRWLANWAFFHMNDSKKIDNPDERIAVDVDHVTAGTIAFSAAVMAAILSLISFLPIMWSYNPWLVAAGLGYATFGTLFTRSLGLRLVGLNFVQRFVEGNLRTLLVAIKLNTLSIAMYQGEKQEIKRLENKFGAVINNTKSTIRRNVILTGVTKSYEYVNQLLPFWIIGPLVTAGALEVGAVPSASQAFGIVMGSLSLLISSFKVLADLAADVNRLYDLDTELRRYENVKPPANVHEIDEPRVEIRDATVVVPDINKVLITNANLTVEPGERVQIVGRRGCGKSSLFRTVFGLWVSPTGEIFLPHRKRIVFVPQNNYIFEGTLREVLLYPGLDREVSDDELLELLKKLKLTDIIERDGIIDMSLLDVEAKWQDILSGGQQQSVGFFRLFLRNPDVVFLDEATSSLDEASQSLMYDLLIERKTTVITVGHRPTLLVKHHKVYWVDGITKSARTLTVDEYKRELAADASLAGDLAHE